VIRRRSPKRTYWDGPSTSRIKTVGWGQRGEMCPAEGGVRRSRLGRPGANHTQSKKTKMGLGKKKDEKKRTCEHRAAGKEDGQPKGGILISSNKLQVACHEEGNQKKERTGFKTSPETQMGETPRTNLGRGKRQGKDTGGKKRAPKKNPANTTSGREPK